ncbi:2-phospho-L-lactate guanylyltransferase [Herbiconiux sp. YIM B11900]|uniref:2-phospho-L-lactate guanylyltransferase n=1 Tax=Herbiconiux sp. YIM B11900 TaxID=3404131 RepID=UPI003F86A536
MVASETAGSWTVVVPVKGTPAGKSRLAPGVDAETRVRLMQAFASDAVASLLAARRVARVIVVTEPASDAAALLGDLGAEVVADPRAGLNAAVAAGIAAAGIAVAGARAPVAALLGDLPCLGPDDIDLALEGALEHPLAFVPDAAGLGTTLITARPGETLVPRFGEGSAERHRAAGHHELELPAASGLRLDVDTEADLARAVARGVGPATLAALARRAA